MEIVARGSARSGGDWAVESTRTSAIALELERNTHHSACLVDLRFVGLLSREASREAHDEVTGDKWIHRMPYG